MNMSANGHAIIVGGAGGIGSAVARRLASEGYQITIADLNLDHAKSLLPSFEGSGHEAVQMDVTNDASVDAALDAIEAREPARVLVVSTGGMVTPPGQMGNIATLSTADWNKSLVLNVNGVFFCLRKFAQLRGANRVDQARIIVIGSGLGQRPEPGLEGSYATSKAAIFGLVRQAAVDFSQAGITVNTIAPGPIATEAMLRYTTEEVRTSLAAPSVLKRLGTPEEVSSGVAFLASQDSGYITGTTLDINGGIHMH